MPSGGGGRSPGRVWRWIAPRAMALAGAVARAGGLPPESGAGAAATVEPFAVDVASGVERSPGAKDHAAVSRFVRNAGRALGEAEEVYE